MDIKLTIALPMYRAQDIAWCALESLCEQVGIDFGWELIVAEEKYPLPFGRDKVFSYEERLRKVGCHKILYLPIESWIPLSAKWHLIAEHSSESELFLLQAADFYNSPKRLKSTYDIYKKTKANWIKCNVNLFYNIKTGTVYTAPGKKIGTNIAFETKNAKRIPLINKKRGIDNWIYGIISSICGGGFIVAVNNIDNWEYSFNIHGLNNLSNRKFNKSCYTPAMQYINNMPPTVEERLRGLVGVAGTMSLIEKK